MKRGVLILSLFLVSILVISGCADYSRGTFSIREKGYDDPKIVLPDLVRTSHGGDDGGCDNPSLANKIEDCILNFNLPVVCEDDIGTLDLNNDDQVDGEDVAIACGITDVSSATVNTAADPSRGYVTIAIVNVDNSGFDIMMTNPNDEVVGVYLYLTGVEMVEINCNGGSCGGDGTLVKEYGWKVKVSDCDDCDYGKQKISLRTPLPTGTIPASSTPQLLVHLEYTAKTDYIGFATEDNKVVIKGGGGATLVPVPEAVSVVQQCEDGKFGDVDTDSGITGDCCFTGCSQNANLDQWFADDCGGPAGDARFIDYIAVNWGDASIASGFLGCTEDELSDGDCNMFYRSDINGNGWIDSMDALCVQDYASQFSSCNDGNGWCEGQCISDEGPCAGLHVGENCCIPIED